MWDGGKEIFLQSGATGEMKSVATLPFENLSDVDMTPDGKRIICTVDEKQSDVWLMENFDPEAE